MRTVFFIFIITTCFWGCKSSKTLIHSVKYTSLKIDTLLLDDKLSCRALLVDNDKIWFAANRGKYGCLNLDGEVVFSGIAASKDIKIEFRSIAQNSKSVFLLSVATPALLYKIDKSSMNLELVYTESGEKVFYDSMTFLNENEGIAVGDPTSECPSIIITKNGGVSWEKIVCTNLPKFENGEAFFAASNTNIIYRNGTLFMISGGKKSRVFSSTDKGRTWKTFETPIIQGGAMTGAFCADFYDKNIGIIAGGNYEKLSDNYKNKAFTTNGGKNWETISDNEAFGYASCVQFLPKSKGNSLLEVGANGVFYSSNRGKNWTQLVKDSDFLAFRFINENTAVASGKNRIVKFTLK